MKNGKTAQQNQRVETEMREVIQSVTAQPVFSEVTWSQAGLLLVNRYLKRTAAAGSDVSSSPVRFQHSGRIDRFGLRGSTDATLTEPSPMSVCSRGSVVVTSDLWFTQPIGPEEAGRQLKAGLQAAGICDSSRARDRSRQDPDHRWDPRGRKQQGKVTRCI